MSDIDHANIIAILALGGAVFFGGLQLNVCNYFWPFLIFTVIGCLIFGSGVSYLIYRSAYPSWLKIVSVVGLAALLVITWMLLLGAYRTSHVAEYISVYERNPQNWDNERGGPRTVIRLGPDTILRKEYDDGPALFTPVVGTAYETLASGAEIYFTIPKGIAKAEFPEYELWRVMWTTKGQTFWGNIDEPVRPGKTKKGPDEMISVRFPIGTYKIDYSVEGESTKACPFSVEGHFDVQIY